jgi:hypothetical protein
MVTTHLTAQVTNSSITGFIKTNDNNPLEGVSIVATHLPSGSRYSTVSKKGGLFTLPGLRTGGPYTVKFTYVGLKAEEINDIFLNLGEPFTINQILSDQSSSLKEVSVVSTKKKTLADKSGGASTVINQNLLNSLPTISRSINDFTRLTPQANGTSFAGRDGRFNNTSQN